MQWATSEGRSRGAGKRGVFMIVLLSAARIWHSVHPSGCELHVASGGAGGLPSDNRRIIGVLKGCTIVTVDSALEILTRNHALRI